MTIQFSFIPVRVLGWIIMVAAAIAIGVGLELTDTPWFAQVVLWPFMYIHIYNGYLCGQFVTETQSAILTVAGAYVLRIVFVITGLLIFFKYL